MRTHRCRRALSRLAVLLVLWPVTAAAQRLTELSAGARVRLQVAGQSGRVSGALVRTTTDSISLVVDRTADTVTYAAPAVRRAEVSIGARPGHVVRRSTWGAAVGFLVGATAGLFWADGSEPDELAQLGLTVGVLGAIPGVVIGTIYGHTTSEGLHRLEVP